MRIALDIMGGDNAPHEIVAGGLLAAVENPDWEIIMVGTEEVFASMEALPPNIRAVYCGSVMAMDESVENLRSKKDSSIWVATELVKNGEAEAVVSAGSTAAQMATAVLLLGRIKGSSRPAIGTVVPTLSGGRLLLDIGANTDSSPELLLQFAQMGDVYSKVLLKTESPRIALLSNGTEEHKGNEMTQAAHKLLAASDLNFIGNMEGRDIAVGNYDVMVTDGFAGNIALKTIEGVSSAIFSMLKDELSKNLLTKAGAVLIMPGLKDIKAKLDYAEYGGAPLFGVRGVSIICHGSSNAKAMKNAVKAAVRCYEGDFIGKLASAFAVTDEQKQ